MSDFLTQNSIIQQLNLGRAIEQWIGSETEDDYPTIKWLRIDKEKDKTFSVTFFEVFDEGNLDFLDLYEFSSLDPDLQYGLITSFESFEDALEFASNKYSTQNSKYVAAGKIQDLYESFLQSKGLFED